jgi:hypothetical protein
MEGVWGEYQRESGHVQTDKSYASFFCWELARCEGNTGISGRAVHEIQHTWEEVYP